MTDHLPPFEAAADGETISLRGTLANVTRRTTKQGRRWATAVLQHVDGCVEVRVYPKAFDAFSCLVKDDAGVTVTGMVDRRDDVPVLCVREVQA